VLNKKFMKFHSILMEGFKIDLKTFWGLAMPDQDQASFCVIILDLTFKIPIYIVLLHVLYD